MTILLMNQIHRHVYLIYVPITSFYFQKLCRQLCDGNTLDTTQNTKGSINHRIQKTKHHPTAESTEISNQQDAVGYMI